MGLDIIIVGKGEELSPEEFQDLCDPKSPVCAAVKTYGCCRSGGHLGRHIALATVGSPASSKETAKLLEIW